MRSRLPWKQEFISRNHEFIFWELQSFILETKKSFFRNQNIILQELGMLFPGTGGHFPELKEWLSAQCSMLNLTLNLLLLSHVLPQLLLFANWTSCCYFGLVYNAAFSWPLTPVLLSALETINWATRKWRKLCNVDVKCMELRRCEQSLTSQPGRKLQNGKQGKQFDINKKGRLDIIYIYLHKIWNENKEQSLLPEYGCICV